MAMPGGTSEPIQIYQIKVTLPGSHPTIWRRIQVRSDTTLAKLYRILQRVMGWEDAHLHQFVVRDEYYGIPDQAEGEPRKTRDERKYTLSELVAVERGQFVYHYDFGDNWEHVLAVEKTLPPRDGVRYPLCLEGARACPPGRCGRTIGP